MVTKTMKDDKYIPDVEPGQLGQKVKYVRSNSFKARLTKVDFAKVAEKTYVKHKRTFEKLSQ